jgi:hypothetical protein
MQIDVSHLVASASLLLAAFASRIDRSQFTSNANRHQCIECSPKRLPSVSMARTM